MNKHGQSMDLTLGVSFKHETAALGDWHHEYKSLATGQL